MEIGKVYYPENRSQWRNWLEKNHETAEEIWLQRFRKATGKPSVSYDELVEECLCFGWIDGLTKKYDDESSVQRITPRRAKTSLSELNRQRIWKLQSEGLMTEAGIRPIADQIGKIDDPIPFPDWLREAMQEDPQIWKNFQAFPLAYRRLKIAWVAELSSPSRRGEKEKRLNHLLKMTAENKRYGTEPLRGTSLELLL